jgi:hypothetical protein
MTLEIHPLCKLFPAMDAERLAELADDIKRNGLLEPIVIYQDQIMDGRNRHLACLSIGMEPATVEFDQARYARSPEEFVWSKNMERRDLTASQRAMIAAEWIEMHKHKPGPKESLSPGTQKFPPQDSRKEAAKKFRVSEKYVEAAVALKKKDPETSEEVKAGKKPLKPARRESKLTDAHVQNAATPSSDDPAKTLKKFTTALLEEIAAITNRHRHDWTFAIRSGFTVGEVEEVDETECGWRCTAIVDRGEITVHFYRERNARRERIERPAARKALISAGPVSEHHFLDQLERARTNSKKEADGDDLGSREED